MLRSVWNLAGKAKKAIAHIKITRPINRMVQAVTSPRNDQFFLALNDIRSKGDVDLLCFSLDCAAGEQAYARAIVDQLDIFSRQTLTPVHTFAEDLALDVGYLMLLGGQEITANPFATIGDIAKTKKVDVAVDLMNKLNLAVLSYLPKGKIMMK